MTEIERECPTCRSRQKFRQLNAKEKEAVREKKGPRFFVGNLWRCTAEKCLWYQPYLNRGKGDLLPESFRVEAAAGQ